MRHNCVARRQRERAGYTSRAFEGEESLRTFRSVVYRNSIGNLQPTAVFRQAACMRRERREEIDVGGDK